MYTCPHCQQPGISVWRRAFLGPTIPATCTACGRKIGVPWGESTIAVLPLVLSVLLSSFTPNLTLSLLVVLLGAAAMLALFYFYVPREAR
jgi:hypothetical protein